MERLTYKRIGFFLKIAIAGTILWLIFRKINLNEVLSGFLDIKLPALVLLVITTLLKLTIQSTNWNYCLKINGDYQPIRGEVLRSFFIGTALRFLLPGGHGTFGKAYYLSNSKKATLISVGIEKFLQTWIALFTGSIAAAFFYRQLPLALRLGLVVVIGALPWLLYLFSRISKNEKVGGYSGNYLKIILPFAALQTAFIFITVVQYYLVISHFLEIGFIDMVVVVPLILLGNVIPISYAGLGVRESFAIHLLATYQVNSEIAVTASLFVFLLNSILPALAGVWFILTSKKR